jgi:hypothetical protein
MTTLSGMVAENSVWAPVQTIGAIADRAEHWITFDSVDNPPQFFSEPQSLTAVVKGESVAGLFENGPAGTTSDPDEFFRRLAATMVEIAGGDVRADLVEQLGGRDLHTASHLRLPGARAVRLRTVADIR